MTMRTSLWVETLLKSPHTQASRWNRLGTHRIRCRQKCVDKLFPTLTAYEGLGKHHARVPRDDQEWTGRGHGASDGMTLGSGVMAFHVSTLYSERQTGDMRPRRHDARTLGPRSKHAVNVIY